MRKCDSPQKETRRGRWWRLQDIGDGWIVRCLPRTWQVGSETDLRLLTSYVLRMAEPETWSSPSLLEAEDR